MRDRRSSCSSPILLILFPLIGCVSLYFFSQSTTLDCTRQESTVINCQKQSHVLGLIPLKEESINHLQGARVSERCDEDCTYRVELQTAQGSVPLTAYYSSGYNSKVETAGRINNFVHSQEPTLQLKDSLGVVGIIVPVVFILVVPLAILGSLFRRR